VLKFWQNKVVPEY